MNKNWIIAFIAMVFVTLVSSVYAFVQTVAAQHAEKLSIEQKLLAEETKKSLQMRLDVTAAEAHRQNQLYSQCQIELQRCQAGKK